MAVVQQYGSHCPSLVTQATQCLKSNPAKEAQQILATMTNNSTAFATQCLKSNPKEAQQILALNH